VGTAFVKSYRVFTGLVQKAGPYVLLEILLPGGTLFALLLFLYSRRQKLANSKMPRLVVTRAIGKLHDPRVVDLHAYGIDHARGNDVGAEPMARAA
jgi:hypothetical protein